MEIERKGGNCVVITIKKCSFVIDPKLSGYGLKDQGGNETVHILTQPEWRAPATSGAIIIDGPGEYEVQNCSVRGIAARVHSQPKDAAPTATIYRVDCEEVSIAILGNVQTHLSEDDLEALGVIDVLILPVGGNSYSIDPKEAVQLVRTIEPKIVVPTHYQEEGVQFEVPQLPLADFLKDLSATHEGPVPKLKIKNGIMPDTLTVYELARTK